MHVRNLIPSNSLLLLVFFFLITAFFSIVWNRSPPWTRSLPQELAARIRVDRDATNRVSSDFGGFVKAVPAGVFFPESEHDIARLVRFAYESSSHRLTLTPRGRGHSDRGQSVASGGLTVDMRSLTRSEYRRRISVSSSDSPFPYVDAGGEQLWSEVMHETLRRGLSPRSWLDYLDLTVGGTLSVGGLSGQTFRHGPQVSNVYELDVITGKGEMVSCSEHLNSDLFYAALGGLGQFGVITRARIALDPAPQRVRWVGLIYTNFEGFTRDEEYLISLDGTPGKKKGFNYLEGFFFLDHSQIDNWRSRFFSEEDVERISALAAQHSGIYFLEVAMNYDHATASFVDQDVGSLVEGLSFVPGFMITRDLSYIQFLDRVRNEEQKLRAEGLWDVPHPWLNMLVPKSRIYDFNEGVFRGIFKQNKTCMGVILVYPLNKNKWSERMSLMSPTEEVFYKIGLWLSATADDLEHVLNQNEEILHFCDQAGIRIKQYMPHYKTMADWMKHFDQKWDMFVEGKRKYDPNAILSPGQKIFTSSLITHASE